MLSEPFFSIVIPTRNRADTLQYTIKTILNQNFQDYEIIVCNNNSIDNTEEVINSFSDERIKCISSDIDLSMTDNWELAYTNANGQYITYLADNDGFINGSLLFMSELLKLNNYPRIIRWEKNLYNWPCLDSINKNIMYINLRKELEFFNSNLIIKEIIEGKRKFQDLPMLYNSFIQKDLIDILKNNTKRVFHTVCPDISSGFCFAISEKNYLSLNYGITFGANSSKSNGFNSLRKKESPLKEFKKLTNQSEITFSKDIPHVKSVFAAIIESFLKIQELLKYDSVVIDFRKIFIQIINETIIFDENDLEESKTKIIESSKCNDELYAFVNKFLKENPLKVNPKTDATYKKGLNISQSILTLSGEDFNLFNIEQVCKFMGGFYNYSYDEISFPPLSSSNLDIIENSSKIGIWGNGSHSKKFQELILKKRNDLNIYCIIDSFKEDFENKIPILVPQNVDFTKIDYLVIASSFFNEIQETLLSLDLKDIKILKYESK